MLRTQQWPAVVVRPEEGGLVVTILGKDTDGERLVGTKDIFPFPPPPDMAKGKKKCWKDAMARAFDLVSK